MTDEKNDSTQGNVSKSEHDDKPTTNAEPLQLPLGAFIAYRTSGGAKASSREIVVYPDGRVSFGGPDVSKQIYSRVGRKLNDGQMARLRKLLDQVNFFRLQIEPSHQPPDALAHEIIARIHARSNHIEVFDGSIPDALAPLIQQLDALMPKE